MLHVTETSLMLDDLVVRMYNIRFGDAILVTVPDKKPRPAGRPPGGS